MIQTTVGRRVNLRVASNGRANPIWGFVPTTATATTPCNVTSNCKPTANANTTSTATEAPQALPNPQVNPSTHVTVTGLRRKAMRNEI